MKQQTFKKQVEDTDFKVGKKQVGNKPVAGTNGTDKSVSSATGFTPIKEEYLTPDKRVNELLDKIKAAFVWYRGGN
jgi:hypothetical protein